MDLIDRQGDTISRQLAIDAMEQAKEQYFDRRVIIGKMQDIVNNLPSAEPDPSDVARDIATIIENEKDMRVIAQPVRKGEEDE